MTTDQPTEYCEYGYPLGGARPRIEWCGLERGHSGLHIGGGGEPGFTNSSTVRRTMGKLTAKQAAALAGIGERSWTSYVARKRAPQPVGYDPDTGLRVWDEQHVRDWIATRPGRGSRTDLRSREEP